MQSVEDLIQKEMDKRAAVVKATRKAGVGVVTNRDADALRKAAGQVKSKPKPKPKPAQGGKTSTYKRGSLRVDTFESEA